MNLGSQGPETALDRLLFSFHLERRNAWRTVELLSRCEAALAAYENGGELPTGWTMPSVRSEEEDPNEPFDPDEPLPELPEYLNVFEYQLYISKSVQRAFEASTRRRQKPHSVERGDEE